MVHEVQYGMMTSIIVTWNMVTQQDDYHLSLIQLACNLHCEDLDHCIMQVLM